MAAPSPTPPPLLVGRPLRDGEPCPNCGTPSDGNFCPQCGQARRTLRVSVRDIVADWLDDELALSGKLPRTVLPLLLRPGFLTQEYLRGRLARYLPPLRLYLGASVLFFVLLSLLPDSWLSVDQQGSSRRAVNVGIDVSVDSAAADGGSWVDEIEINASSPVLARRLERSREKLRGTSLRDGLLAVFGSFFQHLSTTVFLLLPVFALLLKLLYLRRGRLYVAHFVFALHLHAFAFALFAALLLLGLHPWTEPLQGVLALWLLLYLFLAMRRVYGQGVLKTAGKYLLLVASYSVLLTVGMVLTLLATLLLL